MFNGYWKAVGKAIKNMAVGANLASLPLVLSPKQWYSYSNAALFLLGTVSGRRRLAQRHVWETFPQLSGDAEVCLPRLEAGWFGQDPSFIADLLGLALICRAAKARRVFEIGTFRGYSALLFAVNTPEESRVFTLDLPPAADSPQSAGLRPTMNIADEQLFTRAQVESMCFQNHPAARKITRLFGDSTRFDFAAYKGSVDFFFIDGSHSYDYVRSDTLNALQCCHSGSVLAWHDYGRSGLSHDVSRWLDEMADEHEIYSIPGSSVAYMICR